jgi:hypothetical protein
MTTDKARKRAVRSRMTKTGERYAAARRHVVSERRAADPPSPAPLPPRVADPGMGDDSLVKGTGHDWDHWLRVLDEWDGTARTHPAIARYLHEVHGVPGWWSQTVTVGYERARGLRALHETTRGFEVTVSKTVAAPVAHVWPLLRDPARLAGWVSPAQLAYRSDTEGKRVGYTAGDGTAVSIYLAPKGEDRSTVTVNHEKLADAEAVATERTHWRARLSRLGDLVTG